MRQGQQNRRGRGRGGRKPQNPLSRSFESNGPDVKIRGTAAHIAEKYTSLARDAMASGDLVASESYLQHAEHYTRIIMTAQQQFGPQGGQPGETANGAGFRPRWEGEDEGGGEGDGDNDDFRGGPQQPPQQGREYQGREQQGREHQQGRDSQQGRERQGGGGQDRERHTGDREHHPSGREQHGRRGANGAQPGNRDRDEQAQPEAGQQADEPASDPAS